MSETGRLIYVLTEGEYSDYRIVGVYSTPEKAEAARQQLGEGRFGRIEQYPLDDEPVDSPWRVEISRNGRYAVAERYPTVDHPVGEISRGYHAWLWVRADDEQQAIKAANERRAFLIASGLWITGELDTELTPEMFAGFHEQGEQ
jgi:hypothetical protein